MTKDEALHLALEALYFLPALSPEQNEVQDDAIEAIKEVLTPSTRKPLTKEQIYKIWEVTMFTDNGKHANLENQPFVHLARAIEKAHGIV